MLMHESGLGELRDALAGLALAGLALAELAPAGKLVEGADDEAGVRGAVPEGAHQAVGAGGSGVEVDDIDLEVLLGAIAADLEPGP